VRGAFELRRDFCHARAPRRVELGELAALGEVRFEVAGGEPVAVRALRAGNEPLPP
jgi:hypothetical protein